MCGWCVLSQSSALCFALAALLALNLLLPQQFMWLWGALGEEGLTQHCSALAFTPHASCFEVGLEGRRNWRALSSCCSGLCGSRRTGVAWETRYPEGLQTPLNKVPSLQRALACLCVTQESLFHLALLLFSKGQVKQQLLVTSKRQSTERIQGNLCNVC